MGEDWGDWVASVGGRRRSPRLTIKLAVLVCVLAIVASFAYLQFINIYGGNNANGLAIDWRLKITFADVSSGQAVNYTLPAGIGTANGYWTNHTLDGFGPQGYAPLSTRDASGIIWVQSTQPVVFKFGDFFNIWGTTFNETCVVVPNPSIGTYCAKPAEAIVYDTNGNGIYDPGDKVLPVVTQMRIPTPASGTPLARDSKIKFYDPDNDGFYNPTNDTVIWDVNNGVFDSNIDIVAVYPSSSSATAPTSGSPLKTDQNLKFVDLNGDGHWNRAVPPPVLSYSKGERCVGRAYGLSNGTDWIVIIGSNLAAAENLPNGCIPASSLV